MTYYIVWNESRTEGAVFDDRSDAEFAARHRPHGVMESALADAFRELNEDDALTIEEVEIPTSDREGE